MRGGGGGGGIIVAVKRWIVRLGVIASLVLFVATVTLWLRTHTTSDQISYSYSRAKDQCWITADSVFGMLGISVASSDEIRIRKSAPRWSYGTWPINDGLRDRFWQYMANTPGHRAGHFLGIWWERETIAVIGADSQQQMHALYIPYPHLAVVFLILPALWLWRRSLQLRRRIEHRCLTCGYDLRATPERCPECGCVASDAATEAA
jgi:hypothetical protein